MEQYHYTKVSKALFNLPSMVTQYIGYLHIKKSLSNKSVYENSIGKFGIKLSGSSIGILVMVQVDKRYHD
jgi:hypothetical protein